MKKTITGKQIYFLIIIICELMFTFFIPSKFDCFKLAIISIIQLGLLCVGVLRLNKKNYFLCLFLSLVWLFHCGQIVKKAFDIEGTVWLDFTKYGNEQSLLQSFLFYYLSMIIIATGMLLYSNKNNKKGDNENKINWKFAARGLVIVGIIPRLYIDIIRLFYALTIGYSKVNSLPIPSVIQALGFFFDAGVLIELNRLMKKTLYKRAKWVFIIIATYKVIIMITGARQDALCFLIIWSYIYFFTRKITFKQGIKLILITFFIMIFIEIIGDVRGSSEFSISLLFSKKNTIQVMIGNILGEFGAAYCTLIVAVHDIPHYISYGFGRSYIAGICSIIPGLVSNIPSLKEAVTFTTALPSRITFAFGGSFIAESYYNFKWGGLVVSLLVGWFTAFCQKNIYLINEEDEKNYYWTPIIALTLLLFIRGYFVDMVMKLTYLWIFLQLINIYCNHKRNKLRT